jgi:hypothetical protein
MKCVIVHISLHSKLGIMVDCDNKITGQNTNATLKWIFITCGMSKLFANTHKNC